MTPGGRRAGGVARILRLASRVLLGCLLSAALLEGVLRAFHDQLLPVAISNEVASGYHTGWDGIYEFVPAMNGDYPKPHYRRRMAWSGYRWTHRSDAYGFRNPHDRAHADVVLLGDSMVYGHGLEQPDTIAQRLENDLGRPVANLGVQGASIHQEYQILARWIATLEPRWVFVFFLYNDVEDLTAYLTHDEMMAFVQAPADATDVVYFDAAARVDPGGLDAVLRGSYAARALRVLARLVARQLPWSTHAEAATLPPAFVGNPAMALALVFHESALRRMNALAQQHGARFVNVMIHTGQPGPEAFFEDVLGRFCAANDIPVLSLRDSFVAAEARGDRLFLERDGHYSAAGAALAARQVADWILAHEAPALTPAGAPRADR